MRFFSVQFVSCFLSNLELHVKYNFHFGGNFYGMSVGIYCEESFKSKGGKKKPVEKNMIVILSQTFCYILYHW